MLPSTHRQRRNLLLNLFSINAVRELSRLIYLGEQREPVARRLSANYKKLLAIIEEMTVLNMDLLKNGALK